MRRMLGVAWSWVQNAAEAVYRDVLVFGGAGAVVWGVAGYDVRVAAIWAGLFCVWMGLGAPGIDGGS